jgi:hypothetical protein
VGFYTRSRFTLGFPRTFTSVACFESGIGTREKIRSRTRKQADIPGCKARAIFDLIDRGSACLRARLRIFPQILTSRNHFLRAKRGFN